MTWRRHAARLFFVVLFGTVAVPQISADDWPDNYVVHPESASPDGQYAVLVPSREAALDNNEVLGETNYLADVKAHKVLGKIGGADYFEGQNHSGLDVIWAPDARRCVVVYEARYGFASVAILQLTEAGFTQSNIEKPIEKALRPFLDGYPNGYFRFTRDDKLLVRVLAYTNPKQLEGQESRYALFQGTFDLKSRKWTASSARKITSDQSDLLGTAYGGDPEGHTMVAADPATAPADFSGSIFSTEDDKFEALDKTMNETYQGARFLLPAARFAKVKAEQIAWLKERDATDSVVEKSKLTVARIKALQDLIWQDAANLRSSRAVSSAPIAFVSIRGCAVSRRVDAANFGGVTFRAPLFPARAFRALCVPPLHANAPAQFFDSSPASENPARSR